MRNEKCMFWKMGETLKNVQIEKNTLLDLEYGEKTEKLGKRDTNTF